MISISSYASPLGTITLAGEEGFLTGLWLEGQKYFPSSLPEKTESREIPPLTQAKVWLDLYFRGQEPDFTPPLRLHGTPFSKAVWQILLKIPYGTTVTYKDVAQSVARDRGLPSMSAQAVGNAVGHNPVSIIVPCHRVVGSGGSLTGYAGGLDKKLQLLKLEGTDLSGLFLPKKRRETL